MNFDLSTAITVVAGLLYFIAVVPYFRDLFKKVIQPHPVSWFLWSFIGFVNLVFYKDTGATYTQLIAYTSFIIPLLIFIFSFRNWKNGFTKLDLFCLAVSVCSLIVGLSYNNPVLGLTLNILVSDFLAFIPTIVKTFKKPDSESMSTWLITVIANILTIIVINKWTFGIAVLPVYTFIMNGVVLLIILLKNRFQR